VKILLDERVDQRLTRDFVGHEVRTVEQMGWKSKQNGELLALANKDFQVDLQAVMPAVLRALQFLKKGEVREIGI
jgi:hypothetical protein